MFTSKHIYTVSEKDLDIIDFIVNFKNGQILIIFVQIFLPQVAIM